MIRKITIILTCVLINVSAIIASAQQDELAVNLAWESVLNYLTWTKYWYGKFFNELCYNKLIGKTVPVNFYFSFNALQDDPEISTSGHCECNNRKTISANYANVYFEGSNTLFKIRGLSDLTSRPYKFRSFIVLGGSTDILCSTNDEFEELANKDDKNHSIFNIKIIANKSIPDINEISKKQTRHEIDGVVIEAVKRSMYYYIKYNYLADTVCYKKNKPNQHVIDKINKEKKILIGNFNISDPAILVYYYGTDTIYYVDFPSTELLIDKNYCMSISSSRPYLAWDIPRDKSKEELLLKNVLNKLLANSHEAFLP